MVVALIVVVVVSVVVVVAVVVVVVVVAYISTIHIVNCFQFLFMDSAEAEMMFDLSNMASIPNNQFSPKRRGEGARQAPPGGATDRLHSSQLEPGYNGEQFELDKPLGV